MKRQLNLQEQLITSEETNDDWAEKFVSRLQTLERLAERVAKLDKARVDHWEMAQIIDIARWLQK